MKKFAAVLVCLVIFSSITIFAQSARTRPRVVGNTPANNTNTSTDDPSATKPKTAPVLKDKSGVPIPAENNDRNAPKLGGTNSTNQTPTTDPNAKVEEVIDDDEVIKVETNLITIPVTVLNRDGRFVAGVQQREFEIYEDGVKQEVAYFANVEQPFTVVLLLDMSPSTSFQITEIQDAAIAFMNQLRPEDQMMVISFDKKVKVLTEPTNDRRKLREAIMRTQTGDGTSLYDAVEFSLKKQLSQFEGRKAIVLFTDGVDTTSRNQNQAYSETLHDAEESETIIYAIQYNTAATNNVGSGGGNPYPQRKSGGGILAQILGSIITGGNVNIGGGGAGSSPEDYRKAAVYLKTLTEKTGGKVFNGDTTSNLTSAFTGIAEELRFQYSLGYYPQNVGEIGQRKAIRVRVFRPNLAVRARNGYIVGEDRQKTKNNANNQPTTKKFGK